jgi:hypothetical protein
MFTSHRHSNQAAMSPLGALARGVSASAPGTLAIGGRRLSRNRSALSLIRADVEFASVSPMESHRRFG